MKKIILIRGSPASGKTILAKELVNKLKGKVALLILDEFKWIMTAHEDRDSKDYEISFKNYLYALENYLKLEYTIVTEDCWVKKHKDKSTDINKVINLGKKYGVKIHQILLKGSFDTIKHINTLRPMVIPQKELKELYDMVYSLDRKEESIINVDGKNQTQILKEVFGLI